MVQPNLVPFSTEDYYDVLSRREVVSLGGSVGCRAQLLIDSDLEAEFERAKHDEGAEVGGHGFRLLKEHAGRKGGYENPTRAYYAALADGRLARLAKSSGSGGSSGGSSSGSGSGAAAATAAVRYLQPTASSRRRNAVSPAKTTRATTTKPAPARSPPPPRGRSRGRAAATAPPGDPWRAYSRLVTDTMRDRSPSPQRRRAPSGARRAPPPRSSGGGGGGVAGGPTPQWMRAWRARRRGAEASCAVRAFMADTIAEMARQSMSPGSSRAASPERRGGGRGGDGGLVRGSLGVALSDARHTPRPWHPSSGEVLPGSRAEAAPAGPLDNNLGDFGDGNGGARFSVRRQLDGYFSAMRALTPPPAQRPPRGTHESLSFGPMSSGGGAPPVDGAVARELAGWYADTLCSLDGVLGQLRAHAAVVEASMRTGN